MERIRQFIEKWHLGPWFLGIGGAFSVVAVLTLLSVYVIPSSWWNVGLIRDRLPLPAVFMAGKTAATYSEIAENLAGFRHFYEAQDFSGAGLRVDFSTPDGRNRLRIREREIINKLVEDEEIRTLAAKADITVTDADALKSITDGAKANGSDEATAAANISRLYGWDLPMFIRKIAVPNIYRERLAAWYEQDETRFAAAKAKIISAKKTLFDGRSFSDVAAQYSEGKMSVAGGSVGWLRRNQLVVPLQEPARTQTIGVPGEAIESPLGFHILLVNERKTDTSGDLVNVSQIFVKKQSFGEWLTEQLKGADVRVLSTEYQWNPDTATVEFHDPALRKLEKDVLIKSEGDASIVF